MLRRRRFGRGVLWLASAVLAALPAAFASTLVPTLTPIGGEVELGALAQSDFAPKKKPTVELVPSDAFPVPGLTTVKAKVVDFAAGAIHVRVVKALAGVYNVRVTPAEKTTPFFVGGFIIVARPAPTSLVPSSGAAKSSLVIRGSLFGDAKGSVTIGGRKAGVRLWSADTIEVAVPKLAAGKYPVVVTNGAGPSIQSLEFTVVAPPQPGDEYFRADIEGHGRFDVELRHPTRFFVMWDQFQTLTITGAQSRKASYPILALSISPFDPAHAVPYSIDRFPAQPDPTIAVSTYSLGPALLNIASAGNDGSLLTVDVTGWDGEFLTGEFRGTLVDGLGGGADPIEVTNGEFRVRPGDAP